jgi:hypothetical protein
MYRLLFDSGIHFNINGVHCSRSSLAAAAFTAEDLAVAALVQQQHYGEVRAAGLSETVKSRRGICEDGHRLL